MVSYLQSAPSCLSQLSLNQTAVTEATLAVLPQYVPQLRLLNIKQTKVPLLYSHISHPSSQMSSFDYPVIFLRVDGLFCQVRDVSALAQLSSLQTLNLDGTEVTERSLELLASHPALSSLSLAGIPVANGNEALRIISGV